MYQLRKNTSLLCSKMADEIVAINALLGGKMIFVV